MKQITGRVAVVTGGASGIGRATAECLAAEGMRIVLADVEEPALAATAASLEAAAAEVLAVPTDVSSAEQVDALARRARERFGAVHVVFNNAGVGGVMGPAWETKLTDWEWTLGVNLWGVVHGIRSFVPILLEQGDEGHVVSTASMAGLTSSPFMSIYNVTKHAVVTLSETLYHDLRLRGSRIGVSVLCPGFVQTNIMDSSRNRPGSREEDPPRDWTGEGGLGVIQMLREGVGSGYEPREVARRVFEAICDDRFYVLPAQDPIKSALRQRLDEIAAERNPETPQRTAGLAPGRT